MTDYATDSDSGKDDHSFYRRSSILLFIASTGSVKEADKKIQRSSLGCL